MSLDSPPKICCVKVRSVVIFLSIQILLVCLWEATANEEPVTRATGAVAGVLEMVLLWGVVRNVAYLLRISMYISLIHLTFDFGTILVSPVYFASQTASGYDSNDTYPILPILLGAKSEEEDRFILGLLTGYSVEIVSTFSVFVSIVQFVLINQCYVYAKQYEDGMFKIHNTFMRF